jgi:hypothetical protein
MKELRRTAGEEDEEEGAPKPRVEVPKAWFYALLVTVILLLVGGYVIISYMRTNPEEQANPNAAEKGAATIAPIPGQSAQSTPSVLTVELLKTVDDYCVYHYFADGDTSAPKAEGRLLKDTPVILSADNKVELYITLLKGIVVKWNGREESLEDLPSSSFTDPQGNVTYMIIISK